MDEKIKSAIEVITGCLSRPRPECRGADLASLFATRPDRMTEEERRFFEAHVAACAECAEVVEEERESRRGVIPILRITWIAREAAQTTARSATTDASEGELRLGAEEHGDSTEWTARIQVAPYSGTGVVVRWISGAEVVVVATGDPLTDDWTVLARQAGQKLDDAIRRGLQLRGGR